MQHSSRYSILAVPTTSNISLCLPVMVEYHPVVISEVQLCSRAREGISNLILEGRVSVLERNFRFPSGNHSRIIAESLADCQIARIPCFILTKQENTMEPFTHRVSRASQSKSGLCTVASMSQGWPRVILDPRSDRRGPSSVFRVPFPVSSYSAKTRVDEPCPHPVY